MCELAPEGGKDQCAWMENSRGPRWKDRKFMHKDPSTWSQWWWPQNDTNEGGQVQNVKMSRGEKNRPESAQKSPRSVGPFGPAQPTFVTVRVPLCLVLSRCNPTRVCKPPLAKKHRLVPQSRQGREDRLRERPLGEDTREKSLPSPREVVIRKEDAESLPRHRRSWRTTKIHLNWRHPPSQRCHA
jgi:hypothetical protein